MIRFVDNGKIYGWFYCSEGQYLGDGSRADSERIKAEMENIKYVGNAKMIKSLEELPKIGEKYANFVTDNYCISINAFEYNDSKKEIGKFLTESVAEKYLFFKVYFCETKGKYMSFGLDTFYFLYCINKENIK